MKTIKVTRISLAKHEALCAAGFSVSLIMSSKPSKNLDPIYVYADEIKAHKAKNRYITAKTEVLIAKRTKVERV